MKQAVPSVWYSMLASRRSLPAAALAALIGAIILILTTRTIVTHPPLYDEMLHVTAAQGLVATGRPAIADGEYHRAELFTWLVAKSFESQGVSLEAARTPALVASILLVALLGAWITRRAGFLAGASAAVLLACVPFVIQLSVFARFYTLHGLVIVCAAIAAYESAVSGRSRSARVVLWLVTLMLIAVGLHLQPTTVIAVGAGILATVMVVLYDHWSVFISYFRAHRTRLLVTAGAATVVFALLVWKLGLLSMAGEAPLWAAGQATRFHFYLVLFADEMPLLWPMFLPAALIASLTQPRLTLYCTVFFLAAVAVHSLAAAKAERYVFYALPFMFAVWGVALSAVVQQISDVVTTKAPGLRTLAPAVGIAVIAFVALSSKELQRAGRLLMGRALPTDVMMYSAAPDWSLALPMLKPAAQSAAVKIVSSGVKAVYYLGGYDYELNASVVVETESGEEFGRDSRTGKMVISAPGSLNKVLDEAKGALVVVERTKLASSSGVPQASVAVLAKRCQEIPLPSVSNLAAWTCWGGAASK